MTPLTTRHGRHNQPHILTPYFARTELFEYSLFPRTINDLNSIPYPFEPATDGHVLLFLVSIRMLLYPPCSEINNIAYTNNALKGTTTKTGAKYITTTIRLPFQKRYAMHV